MALRTNKVHPLAKKTSKSSLAPEQLILDPSSEKAPSPPTTTTTPTTDAKVQPDAATKSTEDLKKANANVKKEKDPKSAKTPASLQKTAEELRAKHAEARRLNQERAQKAMKIGPERKFSATKGPGNAVPSDAPNRRRKLRVKEPLPDYAMKAKLMLEAAEANTWPGEPTVQGCTPAECEDWCDACDGAITCENSCFLYSTCRNDCS
jgi:hypothetical protein